MKTITLFLSLSVVIACFAQEQQMPPSVFFVANEGQWEEPFAFKLSNGGATYYLTQSGMTIDLRQYDRPPRSLDHDPMDRFSEPEPVNVRGHVLKMSFVGANPNPQLTGEEKLASYSNYFIGRDPCKWRSFVGHYQRVIAQEVWPGIDVEYQAQAEGVETLYHVKPGADVNQIMIEYEGLDAPLRTDSQGNLVLRTSLGDIKEKAPFAYQNNGNKQTQVPIRFKLLDNNRYALACETYDAGKELLIDPLIYSTYFGEGDGIYDLAKDSHGNLVLTGSTDSEIFPITLGAYQTINYGQGDGYVSELTPDGRQLVFSTYLGGHGEDYVGCCLVDEQGSLYVGGSTHSTDWPLADNSFDSTFAGVSEGFICQVSSTGSSLEYSSYIGGDGYDYINDIAQDSESAEIFMCGVAELTSGFPITTDALFTESAGIPSFISIFSSSSSTLAYSTLFPSSISFGRPIAERITPIGNRQVWLAGTAYWGGIPISDDAFQLYGGGMTDGFVSHLDLLTNQVTYSSYIGGADRDDCYGLSVIGTRVVLCGSTMSSNFPVTFDAFDTSNQDLVIAGFVSEFDPPNTLLHSTYLGGSNTWVGSAFIEANDKVIATGKTADTHFPLTSDAIDSSLGFVDGFVCRLSADLSHVDYGTYIGGSLEERVFCSLIDGTDSVWLGGVTRSWQDFPVTFDAFQHDASTTWTSNFLSCISIGSGSGAVPQARPISSSGLLTACPNPFNTTTAVSFILPHRQKALVRVFDVLGRIVYEKQCGWLEAGPHRIILDGLELSSGSYFLRLESSTPLNEIKLVLLK
jgi:hypothetical protein